MFRKKQKAAPAATVEAGDTPAKKRSKLKLAIFATVPIALAGSGYGAWAMFLAQPPVTISPEEEHARAVAAAKAAKLAAEAAAETSATYSLALAVLLKPVCGPMKVAALQAASEAEAQLDGVLVNNSWQAANRRLGTITKDSCGRLEWEIERAEYRAASGVASDSQPAKAGH